MRSLDPGVLRRSSAVLFCAALASAFFFLPAAQAGPVRHRKSTPFTVALQPFRLARSVVDAAAAPIVHNAPRILVATAVTPIKVAYYAPRRLKPRPPRGAEEFYDTDEESSVKPIRVAYSTSGKSQP